MGEIGEGEAVVSTEAIAVTNVGAVVPTEEEIIITLIETKIKIRLQIIPIRHLLQTSQGNQPLL